MSEHFSWTEPVANKRHRCHLCRRVILPGEQYRRCASLTGYSADTFKYCEHCYRICSTWQRVGGEYEWDDDWIIEWLEDERPALLASLRSHWRYPDGELMPWPFSKYCGCGKLISFDQIWCIDDDRRRIERLNGQLGALAGAFR